LKQRASTIGAASPVKIWLQRFAFVLLLTIAFMTLLIGKADTVAVSRTRMALIDALAPLLDAVATPIQTVRRTAADITDYMHLAEENRALKAQNDTLMEWQRVARELQAQNESLRGLLKFSPDPSASFVTAPIIADTSSGFVRSVVILAGAREGVAKGQAAMTGAGLVGRVLEVGNRASRVLLLTDINARIPVIIERTRDQAVLSGDNSPMPELRYLPRDVDIKIGDRIVTSGAGGAFPPGLPVGEVAEVDVVHYRVQPLADLARLEYLRLVNYALPGILRDDLKIDASGYDPNQQGILDSLLTTSGDAAAGGGKSANKKKPAALGAPATNAKQVSRTGPAGTE